MRTGFADERGMAFDAYLMHEVAAHPDAAQLFRLFNDHSASARLGTMFEPLPTTGVPLAIRDDWREVLKAAAIPAPSTSGSPSTVSTRSTTAR